VINVSFYYSYARWYSSGYSSEPNPAVGAALLKEILLWKLEGCSNDDVITRLRQRTVPEGYTIHPWIAGE
jgi:hypothetical protein